MKQREIDKRHEELSSAMKAALRACDGGDAVQFVAVAMFLAGADAMREACANDDEGVGAIASRHLSNAAMLIHADSNIRSFGALTGLVK